MSVGMVEVDTAAQRRFFFNSSANKPEAHRASDAGRKRTGPGVTYNFEEASRSKFKAKIK